MKIKKIKFIKRFGCFENFEWDNNTPEFGKYNFIYGWNYSGKTTLSRIFRCLEKGKFPNNLNNFEMELETSEGIITEKDINTQFPVRVFNEEFVKENLKWHEEENDIEPVLILGEIHIDLEKKLGQIKDEVEGKKGEVEKLKKQWDQEQKHLQRELTNKASEIRNILGITNPKEFDKNKLQGKIKVLGENYRKKLLNYKEEQKLLNFYRTEAKEKIELSKLKLKLKEYANQTKDILSRKISPQQIIEKLKENPELSTWVREGLRLHKDENICQFCGNPIPPTRLEELEKHFSREFDKLMEDIEDLQEKIGSHVECIKDYKLPSKFRLFDDLREKYQTAVTEFNKWREKYLENLLNLIKNLELKKKRPFQALGLKKEPDDVVAYLDDKFQEIFDIIKEHNEKVESFEQRKDEVKEKLIDHFVVEFINNFGYFQKEENLQELNEKINQLETEIEDLNKEKKKIESRIRAEVIGADRINEYLDKFFPNNKLKVELAENGKYKLFRNNEYAKNLSTGERNIISLIYFFAKLEEKDFDLANSIVFIDDPVSSLDSNHIFSVYGYLIEKVKGCGQVFITTHNFEFFNLLKDTVKKDLDSKNKPNFYLVEKNMESSVIKPLPAILKNFKSEYNYLFKLIYDFYTSQSKDNYYLIMPNIVRRFLEAYLFMKYPTKSSLKNKCKTFFSGIDEGKYLMVVKLVNEYSHEQHLGRVRRIPDLKELTDVVEFIISVLEEKDPEHIGALKKSLTENK